MLYCFRPESQNPGKHLSARNELLPGLRAGSISDFHLLADLYSLGPVWEGDARHALVLSSEFSPLVVAVITAVGALCLYGSDPDLNLIVNAGRKAAIRVVYLPARPTKPLKAIQSETFLEKAANTVLDIPPVTVDLKENDRCWQDFRKVPENHMLCRLFNQWCRGLRRPCRRSCRRAR